MRATETVTNRLLLRIVFLAVLVVVLRESADMACDAIALSVYDDRREYAEMFLELSSSFETGMPAPALGVSTHDPV